MLTSHLRPHMWMQHLGLVASTTQHLLPRLPCLQVEHTEEEEQEESLERVGDGKEDLCQVAEVWHSDGEGSREPGQAKQEHDAADAGHEAEGSLEAHDLLSACHGGPGVSQQHKYHTHIEHSIHQQHQQYGPHEAAPEHYGITQEAADQEEECRETIQRSILTMHLS